MQPLDEAVDHVRGGRPGPAIVVYGDYQCRYSLMAVRELERVERRSEGGVRVAFPHFPLTHRHPHARGSEHLVGGVELLASGFAGAGSAKRLAIQQVRAYELRAMPPAAAARSPRGREAWRLGLAQQPATVPRAEPEVPAGKHNGVT